MWFKNLRAYRLTKPFTLNADQLTQRLEEHAFTPCGKSETVRQGWVAPLGRHSDQSVHAANGFLLVCMKREEKVLPAAVVNEALEEKVQEIQSSEFRHISRKERQTLKEDIIATLLPRAFVKSNRVFAFIAPSQGWIVVDAASAKRAEDVLNLLRESVGTLPVLPFSSKNIPTQTMTLWLKEASAPTPFALGQECELESPAESASIIRCKNQDLTADEILQHVTSGMFVRKLALSWKDTIEFVLDHELGCKRIKFADELVDKVNERETDNPAEELDQIFALMTLEITRLLEDLGTALGGVRTEP